MSKGIPITFLPKQVEHFNQLRAILNMSHYYIDTSTPGTGKTFVTTRIWQDSGMPRMLVIGGVSLKGVWDKVFLRYQIPLNNVMFISMDTLAKGGPSQPMLIRRTYDDVKNSPEETGSTARFVKSKKAEIYEPTPLLRQWIREGCFIVADEAQNFKNTSNRHHALRCIIKNTYHFDNLANGQMTSRIALLSGTLMDREDVVVNYMRLLGIVTDRMLGARGRNGIVYHGLDQMIEYCRRFSAAQTEAVMAEQLDIGDFEKIIFELYRGVVQRHVVSSMGKADNPFDPNLGNGYYQTTQEEQDNIATALAIAEEALEQDADGRVDLGAINTQLQAIERNKVGIFVRHAARILSDPTKPHAKVVISLNYLANIEAVRLGLQRLLPHIEPLILTGSVVAAKRQKLIDAFQDPSDFHRIIIGTLSVVSVGISLDDRDGRFPRYAFGSPSYYVINMQQWTYRYARAETKSTAVVRFVYETNSAENEADLLGRIASKSKVLTKTNEAQVEAGVRFPSDYPAYYEDGREGIPDAHIM